MSTLERPQLRPFLSATQDPRDPAHVVVWDSLHINTAPLRLTMLEFDWVKRFNGRTLRDVQADAMRSNGGVLYPLDSFAALAVRLDQAFFLDTPRFRARLDDPERPPTCIGCYEGEPAALRRQIEGLFTDAEAAGRPGEPRPDGKFSGALLPHIDYARGGITYTWGFKEVFERTDAALFVIIATSHYSPQRFTLTRKNFRTPLGVVPTDQSFINRLVSHYGDGLFADPFAHLPEHSIELEVVFLQWYYEGRRPIRIVPLLTGPLSDCVERGAKPIEAAPDVRRMVEALRKVEAETTEPICWIISGDLAHIGPKFHDPVPVHEAQLMQSRSQDRLLMRHAEAADAASYFSVVAAEGDGRRICGLPPTYTYLEAARPRSGKMVHYDQYVHPRGHESVSFASVVFEK